MNIRLTPLGTVLVLLSASILFFDACTCKTCNINSNELDVPETIFKKTDYYIAEIVGADFFEKNIHPDFLASKKKKDKYEVRYNFRMLEYDFVDEEILIITDTLGNILPDSKPRGIPNCAQAVEGCIFNVDKERAIEIGIENGVAEGIKEWAVEFRWSDVVDQYVWHVISTTREIGSGENYKASGEEIMIDPVDGSVLKQRTWNIF